MLLGMSISSAEVPAELIAKAEQEDAFAQFELAQIYKEGKDTPINPKLATKWFTKAKANFEKLALDGNPKAQFILSQMYNNGYGTPPDETKKLYWLQKSAENGYFFAQEAIAYKYRIEIIDDFHNYCLGQGKYFGKGQVIGSYHENTLKKLYWLDSEVFKKAIYWNERAGENGSAIAQYWLGQIYVDNGNEGRPIDYTKARYWWEQAADNGNLLAPLDLGIMYFLGEGGPVDYEKAEFWLKRAELRKNELGESDKKNLEKMLVKISKQRNQQNQNK